jgi:hypothetical protein
LCEEGAPADCEAACEDTLREYIRHLSFEQIEKRDSLFMRGRDFQFPEGGQKQILDSVKKMFKQFPPKKKGVDWHGTRSQAVLKAVLPVDQWMASPPARG